MLPHFKVISYRRTPPFSLEGFQIDYPTVVINCGRNNYVEGMCACKAWYSHLSERTKWQHKDQGEGVDVNWQEYYNKLTFIQCRFLISGNSGIYANISIRGQQFFFFLLSEVSHTNGILSFEWPFYSHWSVLRCRQFLLIHLIVVLPYSRAWLWWVQFTGFWKWLLAVAVKQ